MKLATLMTAAVAASTLSFANAALVWTGAGDGISLYAEANFLDDNGVVPGANQVNPNVAITAATGGAIVFSASDPAYVAGAPSNYGGTLTLGAGNTLLVDGLLLRSASAGIRTLPPAGSPDTPTSLTNGATVDVQFLLDIAMTVDGGSIIQLNGGGNPVNNGTIDLLDTASMLNFEAETWAAFSAEHINKVFAMGAPLVFGADPFVAEPGDNALATNFNGALGVTITVIPEPTSSLLIGLAGFGLLLRRRRK